MPEPTAHQPSAGSLPENVRPKTQNSPAGVQHRRARRTGPRHRRPYCNHRHAHTVRLRCAENVSRFRSGDRLELASDTRIFHRHGQDLSNNGSNIQLTTDSDPSSLADGSWAARGTAVDISSIVLSCLDRLKPGAPGFWFFRTLADVAPPSKALSPTPTSVHGT